MKLPRIFLFLALSQKHNMSMKEEKENQGQKTRNIQGFTFQEYPITKKKYSAVQSKFKEIK